MTSPHPTPPVSVVATPKRPVLDVSVSVKISTAEKSALDQLAFDTDHTLAQLIRKAIRETYPNLLESNGKR